MVGKNATSPRFRTKGRLWSYDRSWYMQWHKRIRERTFEFHIKSESQLEVFLIDRGRSERTEERRCPSRKVAILRMARVQMLLSLVNAGISTPD